jgi:hypothetical protein
MKRHLVKSCCGGKGYIFELDVPISKAALSTFKSAGYKTSEVYTRVGVFFVEKNGLTASGPYGGTKMQVRCGGAANCSQLLDNLENTFKVAAQPPAPAPEPEK